VELKGRIFETVRFNGTSSTNFNSFFVLVLASDGDSMTQSQRDEKIFDFRLKNEWRLKFGTGVNGFVITSNSSTRSKCIALLSVARIKTLSSSTYLNPKMEHWRNSIQFSVNVPVLSVRRYST
jgi:hypothetical protein